jgi:hypothetical protein
MRGRTIGRLQKLEALLLPRAELERPPLDIITTIEDESGRVIKGADRLPGGANYKPGGQKLHIRIVHAVPRPDNEEKEK